MFDCTSVALTPGRVVREGARPATMRQPDYDDAFDATTLFYDVVAFPAPLDLLLFVGPPFLNLLSGFYDSRVNGRQLGTVWSSYYARDRCCDVWIQGWKGGDVLLDTPFGSYSLSPQIAPHHLYAGKRVLYTLSRDNEIDWIIDWVQFHARNHGANAVLLYDNGSLRYTCQELEDIMRDRFREIVINVVSWPYKYGPQGLSADAGWDSDFCQAGAFQDARFRFLATASSVLNCDVDEFVVAWRGRSVFEAAEREPGGYIPFAGRWVSNARHTGAPGVNPARDVRHAQFVFTENGDNSLCPTKWCVVPSSCPMDVHWSTHFVAGKENKPPFTQAFSYRHFRGVSTNWKYQRYFPQQPGRRQRVDAVLVRSLVRAGLLRHRSSGLWPAVLRQLRAWAHPDLSQN
jgi:hypothetical protein